MLSLSAIDMLLVSVIAFSYADLLFILPRSCLIVNGQLIPAAANTVPILNTFLHLVQIIPELPFS